MEFCEEDLSALRQWLDRGAYAQAASFPGFRTRAVYPLQDSWVWARAQLGRPVPLAAHSHPRRAPVALPHSARELHRLCFAHETVDLVAPPSLLQAGFFRGQLEAVYQITALPGDVYILSSIPNRSPGEFVYLGDDSGLLIEAAGALQLPDPCRVLDICCGCGVIGLCLPDSCRSVVGVDLNEDAIGLARANRLLNPQMRECEYRVADLWAGVEGQFDLVLGNPPALPFLGPHLRFADGGQQPTRLTVGALEGLRDGLRTGGQAVFLTFSQGDQLWTDVKDLLGADFSLLYQVRESFAIRGGRLDHVWIRVRRDGKGRRIRRGLSVWDRLSRIPLPFLRPGAYPQQERLSR